MKASLPFNYNVYAKKNKLYVIISYKNANGKRIKKWIPTGLDTSTKKKEVNSIAEKIASEFYNDVILNGCSNCTGSTDISVGSAVALKSEMSDESSNNDINFIEFMNKWLEYKKSRVAKLTYQTYNSGVKCAINYFAGRNLTIQSVKPIDIQDYYNSLIKNGMKVTSMKTRHLCLHNIFEYAVKLDLIPFNPTSRVDMPKSEKHEASFYNKEELDELFKVFINDRMELVVHIAAYYGLRRSEIIGLKWDSIDFTQKTITIRRKVINVSDDNGRYKPICEDKLKTNATRRTLPLIPHIEKLLKEKKEQQTHFKKLLKGGYNKEYDGFVCTDDMGNLITPEYVTMHFKYVIDKNSLKHIRFHDLRHTCASLLIANHIPLKAVQDWLGHANFQTTANIYSHLDLSSRVESAETIANVLGDAQSGLESKRDNPKKENRGRKKKSSDTKDTASVS